MSRAAAGVAVGAAGTTAYLRPDLMLDLLRSASPSVGTKELQQLTNMVRKNIFVYQLPFSVVGTSPEPGVTLCPSDANLQVEQLSREVRGASRSVTIVRTDPSGYSVTFYIITAAGVAGGLYLTLFRGWRLSDLCYVTQRTFRQGVTSLAAGLDTLTTRLNDVKARLQARIAEVSRKQDEAAAAQAAMRAHLAEVGADVEAVRGQVGQVHAAVLDLDAALAQVGADQRHALHGIYILCKAVGELAAGSSIASKTELLEFTHSPVWQRIRPAGLEGILRERDGEGNAGSEAPGRRQSFLLGSRDQGMSSGGGLFGSNNPGASGGFSLKSLPSGGGGRFGGAASGSSGVGASQQPRGLEVLGSTPPPPSPPVAGYERAFSDRLW